MSTDKRNSDAAHEATKDDADRRGISDGPHGWIQWKGTDVCIDLHCECGSHGHVDGDFVYYVPLVPIDFTPEQCMYDFSEDE